MGDGHWVNAIRSMNESRQRETVSDFEVIVNGLSIPVNRIYLDCHCDYFKDRFASGAIAQDQRHHILEEGFSVESVQQCVQYMYQGDMALSEVNAADVLTLAHKWDMNGVIVLCEEFMLANLNPTTCVEWVKVAILCDLDSVESAGLKYIMEHILQVKNLYDLHYTMLETLIKNVEGDVEKTTVAWNAVKARIRQQNGGNPCDLIDNFPVELLSAEEFYSSVLADDHVHLCSSCREEVTQRRRIHHEFEIEELQKNDCFRMKKLAMKYGAFHVVQQIDTYITTNFHKVCMEPDFLQLVTEDDLLNYISEIDVRCTRDEFDRILLWMKQTADRHSIFPNISGSSAAPGGAFQQSLWQLMDFICCDNSCFLMYLTEKYSSESRRNVQSYIHENFSSVAYSQDIAVLSTESMQRYASTNELCQLKGGRIMCDAVKNWVNFGDRRVTELERVFQTMPLISFSLFQLLKMAKFFTPILSTCYCKLLKAILKKLALLTAKYLFITIFICAIADVLLLEVTDVEETWEEEAAEDTVCSAFGSLSEPCTWIAQYLLLK